MATATKETEEKPGPSDSERIEKLSGAVARHRRDAEDAQEKLEAAEKTIKALTAERDTYKSQADTSAMKKRVQELEGIIRSGKHKEAFAKLGKEKELDPDAVDYLYQLSGWKAESDDIDEEAMGAVLDELKGKPGLSRLFGAAPGANGNQPPPKKPGPASGQGGGDKGRPGSKFTDAQLSDPVFAMRNWDAIQKDAMEQVARGEV
jgi:hypothetical protein